MVLSFISNYINFSEINFIYAIAYTFLNLILWIIVPHLQLKYHVFSYLCLGKKDIASDFFAYILIYLGVLRNLYFSQAIQANQTFSYGKMETIIEFLSLVFMILGLLLVCLSFYRLGLRGMYFGDHFGFRFEKKITECPYNYINNPQYVGTTIFYLASSLRWHSPSGLIITAGLCISYKILNIIEMERLKMFYPQLEKIDQ